MGGADRTIVILSKSRVIVFYNELYVVCYNAYIISIVIVYNYILCFSQLCCSLALVMFVWYIYIYIIDSIIIYIISVLYYIYDIPKTETVKLTSNMYAYVHNHNCASLYKTYDYK